MQSGAACNKAAGVNNTAGSLACEDVVICALCTSTILNIYSVYAVQVHPLNSDVGGLTN